MSEGCTSRWLDVFVTKGEDGYELDDEFVCCMQSVVIDPRSEEMYTDGSGNVQVHPINGDWAWIVNRESNWVMPTWTKDYSSDIQVVNEYHPTQSYTTRQPTVSALYSAERYGKHSGHPMHDIKVGDIVRFGSAGTLGYSDYATVLEKREIKVLGNMTPEALAPIRVNQGAHGGRLLTTTNTHGDPKKERTTPIHNDGIAHYALRLSVSINLTAGSLSSGFIRANTFGITNNPNTGIIRSAVYSGEGLTHRTMVLTHDSDPKTYGVDEFESDNHKRENTESERWDEK